jgi:hypothetical protein
MHNDTIVSHLANIGSRLITEVKQHRTRSVLEWATTVKKKKKKKKKNGFSLPFTKMPRVVHILRELTPDRCCDLGSPIKTHTKPSKLPWLYKVGQES